MSNIKETIEQLKEIYQWNSYMNKQRFISYAKAKYPFTDKEAEQIWNVWELLASQNLYQLEKQSEELILAAMNIAREAYEAVCKTGSCKNNPFRYSATGIQTDRQDIGRRSCYESSQ